MAPAPPPPTTNPPSTAPAPSLKATYTSPTSTSTFQHHLPSLPLSTSPPSNPSSSPLPAPPSASTAQKTAYLSALRHSVTKLQEEINVFLTEKMEDEKVATKKEGGGKKNGEGKGKGGVAVDDEEGAEERYGEEEAG